jgi:dephospho-CoA kinase
MTAVAIVSYDERWPDAFADAAARIRATLGARALRIDHIGSTAVGGLASKDVIDVQISVAAPAELEVAAEELGAAGWKVRGGVVGDHDVPGLPPRQTKRFLKEPDGDRRMNVHLRVDGAPNQRYPLLVRDYLRAHPRSAQAYAALKRELASTFSDDVDRYADVKDPACDLIYLAAEDWAGETGWRPGPSDA